MNTNNNTNESNSKIKFIERTNFLIKDITAINSISKVKDTYSGEMLDQLVFHILNGDYRFSVFGTAISKTPQGEILISIKNFKEVEGKLIDRTFKIYNNNNDTEKTISLAELTKALQDIGLSIVKVKKQDINKLIQKMNLIEREVEVKIK